MNQSAYLVAIVGGVWLALNVWATRYIRKGDEYADHKTLMVISVWITPFIGALMILLQRIGRSRQEKFMARVSQTIPQGFRLEDAPDQIHIEAAGAFSVVENMSRVNGFPLMDWDAFRKWLIATGEQEAHREAEVQRAWLLHLRDAMGPGYLLFECECAFVLSSLEPTVTLATADFIAKARSRISRILDSGLARFEDNGKAILLIFDDEETYYNYVACYYPDEGEFAFSGGMFIKAGIGHFVTKADHLTNMEPVIAHEMTHSALSHLELPVWLDEGLAVNTERLVIGGTQYMRHTAQELREMHDSFWGEQEIQEFWAGNSFFRPDQGNMLSYELARILVEQMNKDWTAFVRFLRHARRTDAGATAARDCLGVDLGVYVCALLGRSSPEEWAPNPGKWVAA